MLADDEALQLRCAPYTVEDVTTACPGCGDAILVQQPVRHTQGGRTRIYYPAVCRSCTRTVERGRRYLSVPTVHELSFDDLPEAAQLALGVFKEDAPPVIDFTSLAADIRAEIKNQGKTQGELAAELGISPPVLSKILNTKLKPSDELHGQLLAWLSDQREITVDVRRRPAPEAYQEPDPESLSKVLATLQSERDALADEREELARQLDAARAEIEGLREALLLAEGERGGGWCKSLADCTQFRKERDEEAQELFEGAGEQIADLHIEIEAKREANRKLEQAFLDLLIGKMPNSALALIRAKFEEVSDG